MAKFDITITDSDDGFVITAECNPPVTPDTDPDSLTPAQMFGMDVMESVMEILEDTEAREEREDTEDPQRFNLFGLFNFIFRG